jgi:hypothetical protein
MLKGVKGCLRFLAQPFLKVVFKNKHNDFRTEEIRNAAY